MEHSLIPRLLSKNFPIFQVPVLPCTTVKYQDSNLQSGSKYVNETHFLMFLVSVALVVFNHPQLNICIIFEFPRHILPNEPKNYDIVTFAQSSIPTAASSTHAKTLDAQNSGVTVPSFVLCKNQDITKSQRHHFIDRRMQSSVIFAALNFLFCRLLDIFQQQKRVFWLQSLLPQLTYFTLKKLIRAFKVTGQLVSEVLIWVQVAYANLQLANFLPSL